MNGSLGAELRANLIQQLTNKEWEENPLITIGLSPQILDLGIEDEKLHKVCIRIARTVLAEVHPDQVENRDVAEALVKKYSQAFDLIKERLIFDEALREFRQIKNEQRSNINDLSRQLTKAKDELSIANQKLRAYESANIKAASIQEAVNVAEKPENNSTKAVPAFAQKTLEDFRKSQGVFVGYKDPSSKRKEIRNRTVISRSIEAAEYVLAIRLKLTHSNLAPTLSHLPKVESLYNAAYELHQMPNQDENASIPTLGDLLRQAKLEFNQNHLYIGELSEILDKVKTQSKHFPRIKWGLTESYHHYGFNHFNELNWPTPLTPNFLKENPEYDKEFIIKRFYQGLREIKKRLLKPVWVSDMDLYPVILKLEKGFYSEMKGGRFTTSAPDHKVSRVIGSFLPEPELITEAMRNSTEISETMLRNSVHPLLQKGSFLVRVNKTHVLIKGKNAEEQLLGFYNRIRAINRHFHAEYYILELK